MCIGDGTTQSSRVLTVEGVIDFPASDELLDPNEFFNQDKIWFDGVFRESILPVLQPVRGTPTRSYLMYSLDQDASDSEILEALPEKYLAQWEHVASLIEMSSGSAADNYLMYMTGINDEVFVVLVCYMSDKWCILVWEREKSDDWCAGDVWVLCPGDAAC